jgi:hypothetical protein
MDPEAVEAPSVPSAWMVSPAVDLLLFVGVTLTTLGPWIASDLLGISGSFVLVAVACVNGPHLVSTWTRVYMLRRERFRRPFHYCLIPGLLAAFAILSSARDGLRLVHSVIFYWASWHFVSQSWGVLKIYQRKHGAVGTPEGWLEKALVYLPAGYFVMRRLRTGPWELFGSEIYHPTPPWALVSAVGALIVALAVAYSLLGLARRRRGEQVVPIRPAYLIFNALGFFVPYAVINDGTSAFAAAALWHAIQYVAIVWLYNRRRYAGRSDPDAPLVAWCSQPGRALAYIALLAGGAGGVYAIAFLVAWAAGFRFEQFAIAVWSALTLGHYYLDGVIWKFDRYDLRTLQA